MRLHERPGLKLLGIPYEWVVSGAYFIAASTWILVSDAVVGEFSSGPEDGALFQTYKGIVFVSLTTLALAYVLRRIFRRLRRVQWGLAESENRYRSLIENQSEMIVKVDLEGRFLYVSPKYLAFFGKSEAELLGKPFMDFVHEKDRAETWSSFKSLLDPPYESYVEQRAFAKDGWRWLAWRDSAILNDEGQVEAIIGVGHDITKRKDAERAHEESAERLRLATTAAGIGVWEYDFRPDRLIWDAQMFMLFDVDPDDFDGTFDAWKRCVHPDDVAEAEATFDKATREQSVFECEFRVVTRTGDTRLVYALGEIRCDDQGLPRRAIGINRDVTRQQRMVEALKTSEQDYQLLFENMTTGFMLLEVGTDDNGNPRDFRFARVNAAAEKIAGRSRAALLGRLLNEVFDPLEAYWVEAASKVFSTGESTALERPMEALDKVLSVWMFVPKPGFLAVVVSDVSSRRAAEEEVARARAELERIIHDTKDVIYQIDMRGNYIFASPSCERLTGYTSAEVVGMNIMDFVEPEYQAEAVERLARRQRGERPKDDFSFELRRKDGSLAWVELSSSELYDTEGRIVALQGVARDVTERKEYERRLEESKRFLRVIIDTIPAGVFWKDLESAYLGGNTAFARDLGVEDPEQLIGRTDFELDVPTKEAEYFRHVDVKVMEQDAEWINREERVTSHGGLSRWISTSKVPIRSVTGEVVGLLGAYQDITERKRLEEERVRLSTAMNQSAEGIVMLDNAGRVGYVNPAFERITGHERDEVVGRTLSGIDAGYHDAELLEEIWSRLPEGVSWNGRIVNRRPNGEVYSLDGSISPVRDDRGEIVNHVVTLRDVSAQLEMEDHIRQAQKMDAVGRLAGGVAHDFNNILQSILGFSGMLLAELEDDSRHRDDVEEIRKAAHRASELTRQLLALSRKRAVEYVARDLNAIIQEAQGMLRRLIGDHIRFEFALASGLRPARADASQIEQILLNLVINARDAMPRGGRLLIATSNEAAPAHAETEERPEGAFVRLSVTDTGCGISEDVREHIFEPFFTTKKVGEGTGLGLSVVYGVVQRHGGSVEVESAPGEGSTFHVYLPAAARPSKASSRENEAREEKDSVEGRGERVLVVEDDPVVRRLNARILGDAGYEIEAVGCRTRALDLLTRETFDLLLIDVVLPDGDGEEIARRCREKNPETAILLCSGYARDAKARASDQMNGYRYAQKPMGTSVLLRTTREMLDERRGV